MGYTPSIKPINSTVEAIFSRQSCRAFERVDIPHEHVITLAECARSSPSACNYQNVNIFVLEGADKVADFSVGLEETILADAPPIMKRYSGFKKAHSLRSFVFYDAPVAFFLTGNDIGEKALHLSSLDASHCSQSIQIAAKSMGYESICVGCITNPVTSIAVMEYLKAHSPDFPWEEKPQKLMLAVGVGKPKAMKSKPSRKENIFFLE
ncbi:nitroreductase family protein [Aduncisulcus paluster]|uniref:Nitroreductase family protein n=1 Tax=Aduncisulcus paluster TaxID=2918883 RepID=A0ABQ5JXZ7_9EUKA|nr:nitroreductase family protein [Aduncisulcus paluster]